MNTEGNFSMNNTERISPDDPRVQRGLQKLIEATLPKPNPKYPYYNKETALKVKSWLDELHTKEEPVHIAGTVSTVRLKYYQGAKYLYEQIDPAYEDLYRRTRCTTTRKYIQLTIREQRLKRTAVMRKPFNKDDLLDYLENAQLGSKFYIETVLVDEDINWVKDKLTPLEGVFVWSVTEAEIKIIKVV